jgi:hypothetical protein
MNVKVAINVCHGGFGLSPEAIKLYCKKVNISCYFFNIEFEKNDKNQYTSKLTPTDDPIGALRWRAFSIPNPNQENAPFNFLFKDDFISNRSDKFLIETIEELGEKANGSFAKLKIVEIPDDVKWHIAEYDGWEWVAENHRIWE